MKNDNENKERVEKKKGRIRARKSNIVVFGNKNNNKKKIRLGF